MIFDREPISWIFLYNFLHSMQSIFFSKQQQSVTYCTKQKLQMNKPHAKKSSSHPQQFQTEMSNLSPIVTYIAITKSATNHTKPYLN